MAADLPAAPGTPGTGTDVLLYAARGRGESEGRPTRSAAWQRDLAGALGWLKHAPTWTRRGSAASGSPPAPRRCSRQPPGATTCVRWSSTAPQAELPGHAGRRRLRRPVLGGPVRRDPRPDGILVAIRPRTAGPRLRHPRCSSPPAAARRRTSNGSTPRAPRGRARLWHAPYAGHTRALRNHPGAYEARVRGSSTPRWMPPLGIEPRTFGLRDGHLQGFCPSVGFWASSMGFDELDCPVGDMLRDTSGWKRDGARTLYCEPRVDSPRDLQGSAATSSLALPSCSSSRLSRKRRGHGAVREAGHVVWVPAAVGGGAPLWGLSGRRGGAVGVGEFSRGCGSSSAIATRGAPWSCSPVEAVEAAVVLVLPNNGSTVCLRFA